MGVTSSSSGGERAGDAVGSAALEWRGEGVEERGVEAGSGRVLVEVDPRYFRPTEVDLLIGDPTKARERLGWEATATLEEMVREMVTSDLEVVRREAGRRDRHG